MGPSSGMAPTLTINPDGINSFEDQQLSTNVVLVVNVFRYQYLNSNYVLRDKNQFAIDPIIVNSFKMQIPFYLKLVMKMNSTFAALN